MLTVQDILEFQAQLRDGLPPSALLRRFASCHPDASIPELMRLLQAGLGLPYEDVQCVGGWWHDGSAELSDRQLDTFLHEAIRRANERSRFAAARGTDSAR